MSSYAAPVTRYMSAPVYTAGAEDSLQAVFGQLVERGISAVAVRNRAGALAGVVSRTDLLRDDALREDPDRWVAEVMTVGALTVPRDATVAAAAAIMVERGVHRVFVTAGDELVGVCSTRDLMCAVRDVRDERPIEAFMSRPIFAVEVDGTLASAVALLGDARITGVVVVDDEWPVGTFRQIDALAARDRADDTPVDEVMDPAMICMPAPTKLHWAARQAVAMNVRRVIATHHRKAVGILSGLDFARAVARG